MAIRIQLRRDTSANWASANPVLRAGEIGIETDTLKFKVGNGSSAWNSITAYANVVPADLNTTLNDYLLVTDLGDTVAELNGDQNLLIPNDSIIFEGATPDSYELTLVATDPTADRTITLPDATGTVALTSNIPSNTDGLSEGTTNKYFTDERAQDAVAAALAAGTHTNITVSYNDNAGSISFEAAQGYTDENAQDAVGNAVGNGLDYDDNTGSISVDPSEFALNSVGAPTGDVSMANYKITGLAAPTNDADAATKAYVDASTAGLNVHDSARAATTANIDLSTALENGDTLDGVTLVTGNRVLVKNQTTKTQNGIYVVQSSGAAVRADDYNTAGEVDAGDFIFVEAGTANGKTGWVQTNKITTLGSDNIEFTQFSGAGTYSAGTGLSLTGNTFAIDNTVTTNSGTQTLTNKTINSSSVGGDVVLSISLDDFVVVKGSNAAAEVLSGSSFGSLTSQGNLASAGYYLGAYGSNKYVVIQMNSSSQGYYSSNGTTWTSFNLPFGASWQRLRYINNTFIALPNPGSSLAYSADGVTWSTASLPAFGNYDDIRYGGGQYLLTSSGQLHTSSNLTSWTPVTRPDLAAFAYFAYGNGVWAGVSAGKSAISTDLINWTVQNNWYMGLVAGLEFIADKFVTLRGTGSGFSPGALYSTDGLNWTTVSLSGGQFIYNMNSSNGYVYAGLAGVGGVIVSSTDGVNWTTSSLPAGYTEPTPIAGVESSVTPFSYLNGVTSNIQTQLNSKSPTAGNSSLTTVGTITSGTWNGTAISTTSGGTGLTSYATGDIIYASGTNTLAKLASGTDGHILTLSSGIPSWAAAPISLPSQSGNSGKYLTTDGTTASWGTLVVPIEVATSTVTANTATTIDTNALAGFTSVEYMISLKQGSKIRTSKVIMQTDGTSVDMTEFAITETGGTMSGVVVSATTASTNAVLQVTVTDAASTNVNVKISKVKL